MFGLRSLRTEILHPTKWDDHVAVPQVVIRLFADAVELCNSIEHADWSLDPVIPLVCGQCWEAGCGADGVAHIARTISQLIWMPPYFIPRDWPLGDRHRSCSDAHLLRNEEWNQTRRTNPALPAFESFPLITNHDLFHLWLQQRPDFAVESQHETYRHHLRHHVIASDPLDVDVALAVITSLEDELAKPPVPQAGKFVPIREVTDEFNTLYFNGEGLQEFVTFTAAAPHRLVIGGQYVLLP